MWMGEEISLIARIGINARKNKKPGNYIIEKKITIAGNTKALSYKSNYQNKRKSERITD